MPFVDPRSLPVKAPRPGWDGRFFHSEHMTFAYYDVVAGADVHLHQHPEEEVWHVLEGELEMQLGEERRLLGAGEAAIVPGGVRHGVVARTAVRAIVVDAPVRTTIGGIDLT